MQPKSAVRSDGRNVWIVAQQPVGFPVLAPPAVAQSPQSVGIGDPHGPLFVFRKGPGPVLRATRVDRCGGSRRKPAAAVPLTPRKTPQAVAIHSLSRWSTKPRCDSRAIEPVRRAEQADPAGVPDRCAPRRPASPPPTWRRRKSRPAIERCRPPSRLSASRSVAAPAHPSRARPSEVPTQSAPFRSRRMLQIRSRRQALRLRPGLPFAAAQPARYAATDQSQSTAIPRGLPAPRWSSRVRSPLWSSMTLHLPSRQMASPLSVGTMTDPSRNVVKAPQ